MKLFDKKILDYDYGDDEEDMLNQSPGFQQQHQNTTIEGLDRFVILIIMVTNYMPNYEYTHNNDYHTLKKPFNITKSLKFYLKVMMKMYYLHRRNS